MGLLDPVVPDEQSFRLLARTTDRVRQLPEQERKSPPPHRLEPAPPQKVQVWSEGSTVGDILQANGDGLHPGRLRFLKGATWSTGLSVWVKFIDYEADAGAVYAEHGRYFVGTLSGVMTSGGVTKPLYLCQSGEQSFIGKPDATQAKGTTPVTVSLYHRSSETDSTFNVSAKPLGADVTISKWCIVSRPRGGEWYVFPWECP